MNLSLPTSKLALLPGYPLTHPTLRGQLAGEPHLLKRLLLIGLLLIRLLLIGLLLIGLLLILLPIRRKALLAADLLSAHLLSNRRSQLCHDGVR